VPRPEPAVPLPDDVKAFIERGVSVMVGTRDAELVPELVRAWGPRISGDRKRVSVCVAVAAAAKTIGNLKDNHRLAVTFAFPADSNAIQLWGRCTGTGRPHREDLSAVRQHRDAFTRVNTGLGAPPAFIEALWQRELAGSTDMVTIRFVVEQIFNQTPGPDAGSRL
jgi:predicted pyridoxine 5'-phosphate oxidase superfamily flavin-nucleotide-binding protein